MKRPWITALAGSEAHPLSNAPDRPFERELRLPPEVHWAALTPERVWRRDPER